jgi:hypothetical protein
LGEPLGSDICGLRFGEFCISRAAFASRERYGFVGPALPRRRTFRTNSVLMTVSARTAKGMAMEAVSLLLGSFLQGARQCQVQQGPWLSDLDLYLLAEGTHYRACEKMGAHLGEAAGRRGVNFAVWSPNARQASVIGDCNGWNPQPNALGSRGAIGVWEGFVPDVEAEARYKYHIASQYRDYEVDKAGPHAFGAEIRPQTASRVGDLGAYLWGHNCRPAWPSSRVHPPRALLRLHLVLRSARIGA